MLTLKQCAAFTGLAPWEMIDGANPSAKHNSLLSAYLLNLDKGPGAVREMIVDDIRTWLDLGAQEQAADLLLVLRRLLSDYPEARLVEYSPTHCMEPSRADAAWPSEQFNADHSRHEPEDGKVGVRDRSADTVTTP